jgi:hypothetical protein
MYHMVMFPRAVEEMFKDLPLYFIVIVLSKLSLYILSLIVAVIGLIFEKDKRYNKLNWISVVISTLTSLMYLLIYLLTYLGIA